MNIFKRCFAIKFFSTRYFSTIKNINKYSNRRNKKITIKNLLEFKKINKNHRKLLLNEDLKSRLSEKITELENFPYGISMMPSLRKVNEWYIKSFNELNNINFKKENNYYDKILENIYDRHSSTLITVANGINEYKTFLKELYGKDFDLQYYLKNNNRGKNINSYLNDFYTNRISIRLLISHYLELTNDNKNNIHYNGIVSINEPLSNVLNEAIEVTRIICERNYYEVPNVKIEIKGDIPQFPFIRNNMYYIFIEVLKNSIKSTLDKFENTGYLEDINILICNNDDNVAIKISDKGNGIKYNNLKHVWSYFYSTAKIHRLNLNNDEIKDFDKTTPLAGFGYGLPITKLLVEYFNDNIFINSIEGMGTDVLLYFQKNII